MIVVFYRNLSKAQTDELNSLGWGSDIGIAYMESQPIGEDKLPTYEGAIKFDLFEKACETVAEDKEYIFDIMNNAEGPWYMHECFKSFTPFPRSMSVGDIVANVITGQWFYVASFGFEPVTDEAFITYLKGKL